MLRVPVTPAVLSALLAAALVAACAAPAARPAEPAETVAPTPALSLLPTEDEGGPGPANVDAAATPAPTPAPAASAEPSAEPAPEIKDGPFAMNLYRKGDFVPQYTFEWCVGASLQMMRNLTDAKVTRSRTTQQEYWELARDLSHSPFGGANPIGWTAALNKMGYGPYELVSVPDYADALRVAASAIRDTGRPVGLVMWRGRHAWVMSGFTANADPRAGDDFKVTGIRVLDPLYPHGNARWGASPKPNSLIAPAKLAKQFVFRERRARVNLGVPPGYLLILPTAESAA